MSISSSLSSLSSWWREWLLQSSPTSKSETSSIPSPTSSQSSPVVVMMEEGLLLPSDQTKPQIQLTIRRCVSADIKSLVAIEAHSAPEDVLFGPKDFYLRMDPECPCQLMVAELDGVVCGYLAYSVHPRSFCILSIVVHPNYRLKGIGSALVHSLCHLSNGEQSNIVVFARESNLGFHLFLQSVGFVCVKIEDAYFSGPDEPAYKFILSFQVES